MINKYNYLDKGYKDFLCNLEALYIAYKKCHQGKTDTKSVIQFDKNILFNIYKIKKALEEKDGKSLFTYYNFKIFRPKERNVGAMTFTGRIVQHCLCDNILDEGFEKHLIEMNIACRKNKGTDFGLNYIKNKLNLILKENEGDEYYILKMDIHHFFESIDRSILKEILYKFPDGNVKDMLFFIIDNVPTGELGIPIGNQTSQGFALYYLDEFDRIIKEKYKIKGYVRYMDDAIVLSKDKKLLQKLFIELKEFLKIKRHLEFNPKSCIIPLTRGFDFLGGRFIKNKTYNKLNMRISKDKIKLRKLTFHELNGKFSQDLISEKEYRERIHAIFKYLEKGKVKALGDSYFAPRIEKQFELKNNVISQNCELLRI